MDAPAGNLQGDVCTVKRNHSLFVKTVRFTPDGWLDFRITVGNQTQQACILLEMDMDTHQKPRFQKKIASYVAFINEGLYEQALSDNQCGDRLCHANR